MATGAAQDAGSSRPRWRRSSRSAQNGDCVEAAGSGAVLVRDSKDPNGPRLTVAPRTWGSFLREITD